MRLLTCNKRKHITNNGSSNSLKLLNNNYNLLERETDIIENWADKQSFSSINGKIIAMQANVTF